VLVWNSKGFGILGPGQSTSSTTDDGDYVKVGGVWYKIPDGVTGIVPEQGVPYYMKDVSYPVAGGEGFVGVIDDVIPTPLHDGTNDVWNPQNDWDAHKNQRIKLPPDVR
jgi:hypothetical protein